ncbi:uncharacterized protein LOC133853931 [Alnus glutinosa]|uniref:uncharacterized protein LOC133853931 n=1 Tax=Alnus glutinosa TaxID=3517 RepID=UPI002D7A112A|nr:uncharacterized protein LOC133853931 [Alnus glutinosa]
MSYRLPDKFKMPDIPVYTGLGDPIEHLTSFCAHIVLHATLDEVACRAFPLTLAGGAWEWFRAFPSRLVTSFESLAKKFAPQFMAGIRKDEALMVDLAKRPAEGLQEFLDGVEEFVNQEETLRAFRGAEKASRGSPMAEKKPKQKEIKVVKGVMERRQVKRVEDYNWTPINTHIKEVLMEIKEDPNYKDPLPIKRKPLPQNLHKYCQYHGSYGHWTSSCVTLREMVERYIADGKLTRFLGK